MSRIESVVPKANYCLEVLLDNGSSVTLNMTNRLRTLRFSLLEDKEFFRQVTTDGICIRWDNKIEISMNELFQLVQK
ncbi:MAG: DUF2442 domain-containing protein [Bacillota bacterium]|nr:DUF2442 domain-containing protein [Bacillota bacterium]